MPQRRGRIIAAVLVAALVLAGAAAIALSVLVARAVRRATDPAVQRALVAGERARIADRRERFLWAVAASFAAFLRDVDFPNRYGGEEFTVLLPGTDAEGGRQLAERLRVAPEELPIVAEDVSASVTSSFGVAGLPDESSAAALLRAGDRALYRPKAAGKNAVVVADGAQAVAG